MALKNHKKTITRIFILLVVMTLICMGVFACTNYLEQQSKAFVDMSKVQLIQLDEPESDAPAMKITTTAGTIVAELFPEQAPAYVKQFTELAESGYYDDTYVFSVEKGVYFEAGSPNADGSLDSDADGTYEKVERETSGDLWPFRGAFCVPTTSKEGNILDRFTGRMTSYCGTRPLCSVQFYRFRRFHQRGVAVGFRKCRKNQRCISGTRRRAELLPADDCLCTGLRGRKLRYH